MSGLQEPKQSPLTAFDMNAMIHAIPSFHRKDEASCFDHFPSEILVEIFQWLLHIHKSWTSSPLCKPSMFSLMDVSHVCKRWRQVTMEFPTLWTHLDMNCPYRPEILSELISRSKQLPFSLSIRLPRFRNDDSPHDVRVGFSEVLGVIKKNAGRLRALSVVANNSTFFLILNTYFRDFTFPRLESLDLHQLDAARSMTFGPLVFNPAFFSVLCLKNLMVDCDASCLSGLRVLRLSNASGTILEQTQMLHSTYPAIPTDPVMKRLVDLTVDGTHLVRKVPDTAPPFPPFNTSKLRNLTLARLHSNQDILRRLFYIAYHPGLQVLTLDDLDDSAFALLLNRVTTSAPSPTDTRVRHLVFINIDPSLLDRSFLNAFPNVVNLVFVTPTAHPIGVISVLKDPTIMPLLRSIQVNNVLYRRTTALAPNTAT